MVGQADRRRRRDADGGMSENTVRVECLFEDLADTWIEVPDRGWTLARIEEISTGRFLPADVVALVQRYVTACHLQVMDSPQVLDGAGPAPDGPITNPADLTEEVLRHYMDARLLNFLVAAIYQGARHTFELAPFAVRVSSGPSGKTKPTSPS